MCSDDFHSYASIHTSTSVVEKSRVCLKKYTNCISHDQLRLCTKWNCKYNNPPQAASGKYTCLGCSTGTYIVGPDEIMHANSYPILPSPSKGAQRRAYERIDAERRAELAQAKHKPLPVTPGLEHRTAGKERHARVVEVPKPPKGDAYRPPLRTKHSSAARNLRQRQLVYPANGPGAIGHAPHAISLPLASVAASSARSESTATSEQDECRSVSSGYPASLPGTVKSNGSTRIYDQHHTFQYEVLTNGRTYF